MKRTLLLAGALIAIIAVASVFYNNYPKNDFTDSYKETQNQQDNTADTNHTENSQEPDSIPAMNFTVYTEDGTAVKLSDFYGKPIVVNFWATWCGPCKSELPAFDTLSNEYKDEITFMMVNLTDGAQETVSGVKDFITKNNYTFPVYYDTEMNAAITYGVYSIPATLFIDADGNIVASQLGAMSEDTLKNYIETLCNYSVE